MAASSEVTLAKIFALSPEDVKVVLQSQGRSPTLAVTPEEKARALNYDRAIVAALYYNSDPPLLLKPEDRKIVKHPNFFTVMSQCTSLQQGVNMLFPTTVKEVEEKLPSVISKMTLDYYYTPEEAYIYSVLAPHLRVPPPGPDFDPKVALFYAIKHGSVEVVQALYNHMVNILGMNKRALLLESYREAIRSGSIDMIEFFFSLTDKRHIFNGREDVNIFLYTFTTARSENSINALQWLKDKGELTLDRVKYSGYFLGSDSSYNVIVWLEANVPGLSTHLSWNEVLNGAAKRGEIDITRLAISRGATNFSKLVDGAIESRSLDMLKLAVEYKQPITFRDVRQIVGIGSPLFIDDVKVTYQDNPDKPLLPVLEFAIANCSEPIVWQELAKGAISRFRLWLLIELLGKPGVNIAELKAVLNRLIHHRTNLLAEGDLEPAEIAVHQKYIANYTIMLDELNRRG